MAGRIGDGWLMNTASHAQPAAEADRMTRLELGSTLPVSDRFRGRGAKTAFGREPRFRMHAQADGG